MRKEFQRVTPESVGIPSGAIERLLDKLESGFTEPHGLMIMRHGKICTEGWWAPYAPGLRHGLQSLSKTYSATAVGIACTEGLVKLEDRLIDIFPEESPTEPSENLKQLTVRDVLCMGCGMDTMPAPSREWIRDFLATPVVHEPGTTYMYNSVGSTMLCAIVRRVAGMSVHEYLTPRLYEKIGIDPENVGYMHMPDGTEVGGGGFYTTTEDNLRLMKLYADGGVWEGQRILSADYVAKATSVQNESATEAKGNPEAKDNFVGYGFQIWMCRPKGVYRADGAMGQFSIVVPDRDMIISINETATGAHWAQKSLDVIWEFLDEIAGDEAMPEDAEASGKLCARMGSLALAAPRFAPHSPLEKEISGRLYQVEKGRLSWHKKSWMNGWEGPGGFARFSLEFLPGYCLLRYVQDGREKAVEIATDGTRRMNRAPEPGSPISRLCLHGWWSKEDTFTVAARWVETCFEDLFHFAFSGDRAEVTREVSVGGFGPQDQDGPVVAKRV
ncbi:class C beta-lactamase-related serine hydrolase [Acutalibacter sp. 1XD8-33]|uniref:serine hydrolase domain-containing protein n=1 Tax=Acutalibacter sp. 1XD8-33 TaxID=2320081 RepID=UPI000EA21E94|nr:serine hydrolase [Acutalibacter sp. 1XD8-33]RKJ42162.1 class C beta-lactamase-related serine hydrolase [Acutalibacter sp. 1XD8-33]